jgi:hypothetical protein
LRYPVTDDFFNSLLEREKPDDWHHTCLGPEEHRFSSDGDKAPWRRCPYDGYKTVASKVRWSFGDDGDDDVSKK